MLFLLSLLLAPVAAQNFNPLTCTAFVANQPLVRQEGTTEPTGDIIIQCSGVLVGGQTGGQTLSLYIAGTTITSRQLFSGVAPQSIPTETALLINDCVKAAGCQVAASGTRNAVALSPPTQGVLQNGALVFSNFTLPNYGDGSPFQVRITNVRINANALPGGTFITGTVLATFPVQNQSGLILGAVQASLSVTIATPTTTTFTQCVANSGQVLSLRIFELVNTGWKSPVGCFGVQTTGCNAIGPLVPDNRVPGQWYQNGVNTESQTVLDNLPSAFVNPLTSIVPGQADAATRFRVNFTNVPTGVSLSLPTSIVASALTLAATGGDVGPFSAVAGTSVTLTGNGSLTYEVRSASGSTIDGFTLPVTVNVAGGAGLGTVLTSVTYAPTSLETSTQIPAFADTGVFTPLLNVAQCPSQLAFAAPPASGTIGLPIPPVSVLFEDQFGSQTPTAANVTITSVPPGVSATALSSGGVATFSNLIFDTVGNYSLIASSSGVASATSGVISIGLGTGAALTSSQNPATLGRAVSLTATILPSAATGTVSFYEGATLVGTRPVSGGKAVLTTTMLAAGSHSLRAFYSGNQTYAASISGTLAQTINPVTANGFLATMNYAVGANVTAVAIEDFNGDGKADLAVTSGGNVNILVGNGDGTFQTPVRYGVGSLPSAVVAGDFNRDGNIDIAVANSTDATISVLLGNGDGTFRAAVSYPVSANPSSIAIADFNLDGKPDLVVATSSATVSVLMGNGDGTFQAALNKAGGNTSVAVGDFNRDGNPDIAATNDTTGAAGILLGSGTGAFSSAVSYPTGSGLRSVAVGDFNRDGNPDLIIADATTGNVRVLWGYGQGPFYPSDTYASGTAPYSVIAVDFNGDGILDLIVANNGSQNISVLLGNSDGSFQSALKFPAGVNPSSVAAADFNGDGRLDVAVANGGGNVSILLGVNATQVKFASSVPNGLVGPAMPAVMVRVLDTNGALDTGYTSLVTLTSSPAGVSSTVAAVNGVATFNSLAFLSTGTYTLTASSTGLTSDTSNSFSIGTTGYTVSGQITFGGSGISGVSVALGGSAVTSTTTDASGNYSFGSLPAGQSYTVTPTKSGYVFSPVTGTVASLNANATVNFTSTGVPVLTAPASGATGIAPSVLLSWNAAAGATSYDVRFGTSTPPPLVTNTTGIVYSPGTLGSNTTYYWQIVAKNSGGSAASAIFSFSTQLTVAPSKVAAYSGGSWIQDVNGNFAWDGTPIDRLTFWSLGQVGEVPVWGDWNGDGKTKIGLYVNGTWLLDYNGNGLWDGPSIDKIVYFGGPGYTPYVGDWNGSGTSKIAVHQNGTWLIDYNGNFSWDGPGTDKLIYFGGPGYTPVVGDWNGSGSTKIGVHQNGTWLLDYNGNFTWDGPGTDKLIYFGGPGYTPVVGDWNGSGNSKVGAYLNGLWILDYNGNFSWDGTSVDKLIFFGGTSYLPMVGDWNGGGSTKVGAYLNGQWVLDVNGNFTWDPPVDQVIFFGGPGQTPIVGKW